jgi:hypothetical protein
MTIEAWNIVLSAVILVLLTGGGIWLKYVVAQQLSSKDAAIQALEGVAKFKDAHIASLQGDTAPAIVKAYADVRQHANQVTEDYQNVVATYNETSSKLQLSNQLVPARRTIGEAFGLAMASNILHRHLGELLFPDGKNPNPLFTADEPFNRSVYEAFLDAGLEMSRESINRSKATEEMVQVIKESHAGEG